MKPLKDEIADFMSATKVSQQALAASAGVSQSSISRLLSGSRSGVHSSTADKIREYIAGCGAEVDE